MTSNFICNVPEKTNEQSLRYSKTEGLADHGQIWAITKDPVRFNPQSKITKKLMSSLMIYLKTDYKNTDGRTNMSDYYSKPLKLNTYHNFS